MPVSVSKAVLDLVRNLARVQVDLNPSPKLRLEFDNILVRLKIWAGNVGVFAPDNASLDYRLREDPELSQVLFSMVAKLRQSLNLALQPPLREEYDGGGGKLGRRPEGRGPSSVSSGSSSDSFSLDSDAEESDADGSPENPDPSATFIDEANGVIDRLYRLTMVLRKPASSSEHARVQEFIKKLRQRGEVEELEDAEDHAWSHIKAHFPQLPDVLVNRLVEGVVFRRMRIRYRQRHQAKLHQGLEQAFAAPPPHEGDVAPRGLSRPTSGNRDGGPVASRGKSRTPAPRSVAFSATNATSVNRARFADYARSTALSGITRAAVGRRQQLEVPRPPRAPDDGQDKVECPYCLRLVKAEEMKEPRWTRHVLKDIDPYVCLFEDCRDSHTTLFKTVEEWLGHLQWQHTIVYSCQAAGHEREVFDSPQELENHIRAEHPHTFTESQLPGLIEKGALPAPNTLSILNLSHSVAESRCLLCRNFDSQAVKNDGMAPEQRMLNHILEHLETIALLALPDDQDDVDGVDSNARQSNHGTNVAVERETDDLLPPATFEDGTAGGPDDESVPDQDGNDERWAVVFQQVKQSRLPEPHEDLVLVALAAKHLDDEPRAESTLETKASGSDIGTGPVVLGDVAAKAGTAATSTAAGRPDLDRPDAIATPGLSDNDEEEDGFHEQGDTNDIVDDIVPNLAGFKEQVLRMCPRLADQNTYLVDRIAYQQVIRYKTLLNNKSRHHRLISSRSCPSGSLCIDQGGSPAPLPARGETTHDESDQDSLAYPITAENFPPTIPAPPAVSLPAEFECPICYQAKRFWKPSDWTRHVHEDVRPFTCTWDRCRDPKIFQRKADWVRHENEGHRHLEWWTCDVEDCRHTCYRRDNFLQHLVREHNFQEPQAKTRAAIKRAASQGHPEPIWQKVEQCRSETSARPQDEPCRFCGRVSPTWKKLTVHLALHMERISLPVLRLVALKEVDDDTEVFADADADAVDAPRGPAARVYGRMAKWTCWVVTSLPAALTVQLRLPKCVGEPDSAVRESRWTLQWT